MLKQHRCHHRPSKCRDHDATNGSLRRLALTEIRVALVARQHLAGAEHAPAQPDPGQCNQGIGQAGRKTNLPGDCAMEDRPEHRKQQHRRQHQPVQQQIAQIEYHCGPGVRGTEAHAWGQEIARIAQRQDFLNVRVCELCLRRHKLRRMRRIRLLLELFPNKHLQPAADIAATGDGGEIVEFPQ